MIARSDLTKVDVEPEAKKRREEMDDEERRDFDSWLDDIKTKRWEEFVQSRFDSLNYLTLLFCEHLILDKEHFKIVSQHRIHQSIVHNLSLKMTR